VEKCVGYLKFTGNKPSDSISFDKCFSIKILLLKSPARITSEYFNEWVDNNSINPEYSVVLCGLKIQPIKIDVFPLLLKILRHIY